MEAERVIRMPDWYLKAHLPNESSVPGELLGFDDQSCVHVELRDPISLDRYNELMLKMEDCVSRRHPMPSSLAKKPGTDCIVQYTGHRGGYLARGIVREYVLGSKQYVCYLPDYLRTVQVGGKDIYHSVPSVIDYYDTVVKCKIAGVGCFEGHPYLKTLYRDFLLVNKSHSPKCTVEILERGTKRATVRILTDRGEDLAEELQKFIPISFRLGYPRFGKLAKAKITHYSDSGVVWFQPNNSLMSVIKQRLCDINEGYLEPETDHVTKVISKANTQWNPFVTGTAEIFLYTRPDRQRMYRVRKIYESANTTDIFFVDYGETETISSLESLLPAKEIDMNLCIIPPQCLPVRFKAANCHNPDSKVVDKLRFWDYVDRQRTYINIQGFQGGTNRAQQKQLVDAHLLDPSLNIFPSNCMPFVKNGQILAGPPHLEWPWLQEKKHVLNEFGIFRRYCLDTLSTSPRFIVPPEADIFVAMPGEDENGSTENDLHSLAGIYHSLDLGDSLFAMSTFAKVDDWDWPLVQRDNTDERQGREA